MHVTEGGLLRCPPKWGCWWPPCEGRVGPLARTKKKNLPLPHPKTWGPSHEKEKNPPLHFPPPYSQTTTQHNGGRRWPFSSSPPSPGGAGGHQMTGGRGPSSTPHTPPPLQATPHNHWGPVMGPLEGRECQALSPPLPFSLPAEGKG